MLELKAPHFPFPGSQQQQRQTADQQSQGTDYQRIKSRRSKGLGSTGGAPEHCPAKDQPMSVDGC
jgi:hypothetical protein